DTVAEGVVLDVDVGLAAAASQLAYLRRRPAVLLDYDAEDVRMRDIGPRVGAQEVSILGDDAEPARLRQVERQHHRRRLVGIGIVLLDQRMPLRLAAVELLDDV